MRSERAELLDLLIAPVDHPQLSRGVDGDETGVRQTGISDLPDVFTHGAELQDSFARVVGGIDVASPIDRKPTDAFAELARPGAFFAELGQVFTGGVELLDPLGGGVSDVDTSVGAHSDAADRAELAVAGAKGSELADVGAIGVELLDPVAAGVGDVGVARCICGLAAEARELAIACARASEAEAIEGRDEGVMDLPGREIRAGGVFDGDLGEVAAFVGVVDFRSPGVRISVTWPTPSKTIELFDAPLSSATS